MKALVYRKKNFFPVLEEFKVPGNQYENPTVEVEMIASGMNRRDYYITQGLYPNVVPDVVLGSDGVGRWNGKRVVINPNIDWGKVDSHQSKEYQVLGMPKHGTFADKIYVPQDRIHQAPEHLTDIEAAALPLGGMTAWRAVNTKGQISESDTVLISGIGGGVAQFAFQYALAIGARVYVTSGSQMKIDHAIKMGAAGGISYKSENWYVDLKEMSGGFDVIIDSAGGAGFKHFIPMTNPGGRIVFYGATLGKITEINPATIFWRQISILGTTMATDAEFEEMLKFVADHEIRPMIDRVYTLNQSEEAFEYLGTGSPFGKLVFNHGV